MEGWIKLHRCLIGKPIFDNANLLKVWIWCLCKATHKLHIQIVGLQKIELAAGQFITGRSAGAAEVKLKPSTFWDYMKFLEENQSINIKSNSKYSVVTVDNWGLFQYKDTTSDSETDNKPSTNQPPSDTNKNGNTVNNDNKSTTSKKLKFTDEHMKVAELLLSLIKDNNPNYVFHGNMNSWADVIRLMVERDNINIDLIKKTVMWCQADQFWQSNILSTAKLREKFNQLTAKMQQATQPVQRKKTVSEQGIDDFERKMMEFDRCNGSKTNQDVYRQLS